MINNISKYYNYPDCSVFRISPIISCADLKKVNDLASTKYLILIVSDAQVEFGKFAIERFIGIAETVKAGILYSDYYDKVDELVEHPVIDYQLGSVRDDFNFGHALFIRKDIFYSAILNADAYIKYAGLYELRLIISEFFPIIRIPEFLYAAVTEPEVHTDTQFEYVDPKNRDVQFEMEKVFTEYLKRTGAYLESGKGEIYPDLGYFENEASVIIPVKNRIKTIADAINSVLSQKTDFHFNLIVIDNHSDDGTTSLLKELSIKNDKLIHIIPDRNDLNIGGCWNEGISHDSCGRFAVQLDSDDIYSDENTLQKIVDKFRTDKCAMVIGSYKLTDFMFHMITPGIIDHKEWTDDNGFNNALRINGLGAPRAFYTPVIRDIRFPDVSYGEDYSAVLAVSRNYKIGRIYEPIYICRRWEGNSDALLSPEKQNRFNYYKDKIRTFEILCRRKINTDGDV